MSKQTDLSEKLEIVRSSKKDLIITFQRNLPAKGRGEGEGQRLPSVLSNLP